MGARVTLVAGPRGSRAGVRAGEPQVEQGGVVTQVTIDVPEQVIAQKFGQGTAFPRDAACRFRLR